ncbi:hypothetical protein ABT297_04130 [Dactylosporangium sp. NPDC000555]|uniref:hypothetical protein n=1 Tax=Dactylosporangium sp. NPDC000555 TaxID=3154260 RepID=UPI00332DDC6F
MTDEPTGTCPTCARRDPRTPLLCDVCRSKLRNWLHEIPDLHAELARRETETHDHRPHVIRDQGAPAGVHVVTNQPADPVAHLLPAGPLGGQGRGGPISGSKEPPLPIRVDPVDLTGPARRVWLLGDDQIGHESVASTLDFWVRDWRDARGGRERLPAPTVPQLTGWLARRLDDAMDAHPAIDEFFTTIARTRTVLRAQLGLIDIPEHKHGIPCPKCGTGTLIRHNGSDWIECATCAAHISPSEYDDHVSTTAATEHATRRTAMRNRRAQYRLATAMRTAGWHHHVHHNEAGRDPDGAPEHDGYRVHTWRRGPEHIELWTYADGQPLDVIWYGHTTSPDAEPNLALSIATRWITEHGITALHKIARAAGLLAVQNDEAAHEQDERLAA